jgi:hypothetical protein
MTASVTAGAEVDPLEGSVADLLDIVDVSGLGES